MKQYNVAILGATGAVGQEMMKILAERDFPVAQLHLLASARSVGQKMQWKGQELTVELACDEAFEGMDIVLGAAENDIAERFAPAIVKAGAVFVDNSSRVPSRPRGAADRPGDQSRGREEASRASSQTPTAPRSCRLVAINALNQDSPIESHHRLVAIRRRPARARAARRS